MRVIALCAVLSACTPEGAPDLPPPSAGAGDQADASDAERAALPGEVTVRAPLAGARVTSPLTVEGVAINSFFFEGVFPAELVAGGEAIAQAPAEQQAPSNWTNPGPVDFKAVLTFDVTRETKAELVLREDMPAPVSADSDVAGPARTVRIPVVLVPAS